MQFLQMVQAPVVRDLPPHADKPTRRLYIPKFTVDQFIEWGAEIEAQNVERVTEGLDDIRRREYLSLYPPSAPDINELKRLVSTAPGAKRVVQQCLMKAKVKELKENEQPGADLAPLSEDEIEAVLQANGTYSCIALGRELADLVDKALVLPAKPGDKKEDDNKDPLKSSGKQG